LLQGPAFPPWKYHRAGNFPYINFGISGIESDTKNRYHFLQLNMLSEVQVPVIEIQMAFSKPMHFCWYNSGSGHIYTEFQWMFLYQPLQQPPGGL
jgi:hypothetical protein